MSNTKEHYCCKIVDGIVTKVIVCDNEQWAIAKLGGVWVCSDSTSVGIGYTYNETDGFRPLQPYPSWIWNSETKMWNPPVPYPNDIENFYTWNEENKQWN
jgi:hypothetical protein